MNNLKLCVLRLTGKMIDEDSVSCTGKQFKELLRQLDPWVRTCVWHVSDVKTNNCLPLTATCGLPDQTIEPESLSDVCAQIDQLLSGIFLAVSSELESPRLNLGLTTEEEPSSDLGDAILEIRAFDTSYFEIYTGQPTLLDKLHCLYGAEVEQTP